MSGAVPLSKQSLGKGQPFQERVQREAALNESRGAYQRSEAVGTIQKKLLFSFWTGCLFTLFIVSNDANVIIH